MKAGGHRSGYAKDLKKTLKDKPKIQKGTTVKKK